MGRSFGGEFGGRGGGSLTGRGRIDPRFEGLDINKALRVEPSVSPTPPVHLGPAIETAFPTPHDSLQLLLDPRRITQVAAAIDFAPNTTILPSPFPAQPTQPDRIPEWPQPRHAGDAGGQNKGGSRDGGVVPRESGNVAGGHSMDRRRFLRLGLSAGAAAAEMAYLADPKHRAEVRASNLGLTNDALGKVGEHFAGLYPMPIELAEGPTFVLVSETTPFPELPKTVGEFVGTPEGRKIITLGLYDLARSGVIKPTDDKGFASLILKGLDTPTAALSEWFVQAGLGAERIDGLNGSTENKRHSVVTPADVAEQLLVRATGLKDIGIEVNQYPDNQKKAASARVAWDWLESAYRAVDTSATARISRVLAPKKVVSMLVDENSRAVSAMVTNHMMARLSGYTDIQVQAISEWLVQKTDFVAIQRNKDQSMDDHVGEIWPGDTVMVDRTGIDLATELLKRFKNGEIGLYQVTSNVDLKELGKMGINLPDVIQDENSNIEAALKPYERAYQEVSAQVAGIPYDVQPQAVSQGAGLDRPEASNQGLTLAQSSTRRHAIGRSAIAAGGLALFGRGIFGRAAEVEKNASKVLPPEGRTFFAERAANMRDALLHPQSSDRFMYGDSHRIALETPVVKLQTGEEIRFTRFPMAEVPPLLAKAIISAEDGNFYEHEGIDPVGTARAIGEMVTPGGQRTGGSGITEQVVKHLAFGLDYVQNETPDQKIARKKTQIPMALLLNQWAERARGSKKAGKDWILTTYANTISLGNNTYGFEEAARTTFNVSAQHLTLAQSAYLASIAQAPEHYRLHPTGAIERTRVYVLPRMRELGHITDAQLAEAQRELETLQPISDSTKAFERESVLAVQRAQAEVRDLYPNHGAEGGLQVEMTLDDQLQQFTQKIMHDAVQRFDREYCLPHLEAAAIITDLEGRVEAYVGSAADFATTNREDRFRSSQFDHAQATGRSFGSVLKPIAAALWMQENRNVTGETEIPDLPIAISGIMRGNYDGRFDGVKPLKEQLARSRNTPFMRILAGDRKNEIAGTGVSRFIRLAEKFGIRTIAKRFKDRPDQFDEAAVIGGGDASASLAEVAEAYLTLARSGDRKRLTLIKSIKDANGFDMHTDDKRLSQHVVDGDIAREVVRMLSDEDARDNMFGNTFLGMGAVKTGTSTGENNMPRDCWLSVIVDDHVLTFWMGNTDGSVLPANFGGAFNLAGSARSIVEEMRKNQAANDSANTTKRN